MALSRLSRLAALAAVASSAIAQQGWRLIARDIGGSPLGVAFFEDGLTGVTATSQVVPAGYETKESLDGGYTWNTVPDQDLFVFGLYNSAVFGASAVVSGMSFIQYSTDMGHNFSAAPGGPAGGEIVRKLQGADGSWVGFAILGMTEDGNTNGVVVSYDGGKSWKEINIAALKLGVISTDGAFFNSSWTIMGEEYETEESARHEGKRKGSTRRGHAGRSSPTHKLKWVDAADGTGRARLVRTPASELSAAHYATQIVVSTDGGNSWAQQYLNSSIAGLGIACIDPQHCCIVGEDANFAYIHCTQNGWQSVEETLVDTTQGAALVEIAVAPNSVNGSTCYVAVGGYVQDAGQAPVWYRSCDSGASWFLDPVPNLPVNDLLVTDVDCQIHTPNGTVCWTTLWDQNGLDPNGYVARYFSA